MRIIREEPDGTIEVDLDTKYIGDRGCSLQALYDKKVMYGDCVYVLLEPQNSVSKGWECYELMGFNEDEIAVTLRRVPESLSMRVMRDGRILEVPDTTADQQLVSAIRKLPKSIVDRYR